MTADRTSGDTASRRADLPSICRLPAMHPICRPESISRTVWASLVSLGPELSRWRSERSYCDEPEIQALNKTYRGKDRPTNVLAFPAELSSMPGLPPDEPSVLGDLVVCAPVVSREAVEQGKAGSAHWSHMLVHGMLHLLGFDHRTDADAGRMESLEIDILARRGFENPYKGTGSN